MSTCTRCGTHAAPGAAFCGTCGAGLGGGPAAPSAAQTVNTKRATSTAARGVSKTRMLVVVVASLIAVLALAGAAYQWWQNDAAPQTSAPAPEPPPDTAALAQLAEDAETLTSQQAELTRAMQDAIARYQAQTGGTLPGDIGAGLTPEQRALLTERLSGARTDVAAAIEDLLTRDQQLQAIRTRLDDMTQRLPESVIAAEGQRHERIAMDFLIRQGLGTDAAYRLVSQAALTELLPGFRVFLLYQNGQFGTWVTQGTAAMSPRVVRDRLAAMVTRERDAALTDLEAVRADRDDLRNLADVASRTLEDTRAELKAMAVAAERQLGSSGTLRYVIGSKSDLVKGRIIDGSYRLLPVKTAGTALEASAPTSLPPIDPAAYGLKRVRRITVVPGLISEGEDYQISGVASFPSVAILRPDRFAQYARYFVVVLE